jgi:hypothetical protein
MANPVFIIDIGPDGVVATHPGRFELPVLVAPVPESRKTRDFNTICPQLITIACKMFPGKHFAFDSSFISLESEKGLTKFAKLMQALQERDEAKRFPPVQSLAMPTRSATTRTIRRSPEGVHEPFMDCSSENLSSEMTCSACLLAGTAGDFAQSVRCFPFPCNQERCHFSVDLWSRVTIPTNRRKSSRTHATP